MTFPMYRILLTKGHVVYQSNRAAAAYP